jgi:transglutaminase-like putative cysteine protease
MNRSRLILFTIFLCLLCLSETTGQYRPRRRRTRTPQPRSRREQQEQPRKTTLRNKNSVEFSLIYDFSIQAIPSELSFTTPIPQTIPNRQEIHQVEYSEEPTRIFDENGTKYAEFVFRKPPNQFRLEIKVKATLLKYDLATARKKDKEQLPKEEDPNQFLIDEKYIEKNAPLIEEVAQKIEGSTQTAIVRKLYDYVVNNVQYVDFKQEKGAVKTLQKKQGACTEYSDSFVALCRAKGIPARVVKGYVSEVLFSPQHAWAEVYFKEYGWVPFDLTYGDIEDKSVRDRNFENLKPIYVYLTHTRNDEILDRAISISGYMLGEVNVNQSIEFK